jgi:transposase
LVLGGIKSDAYIKLMDWQAAQLQDDFHKTGVITVIVQDNYTVHKSKKVKEKEKEWKAKGLEFFFLSPYSPELNQIEAEWHQLKTHKLAGRMFEDEYNLAQAVIQGIETRGHKNDYICQRFRFQSDKKVAKI